MLRLVLIVLMSCLMSVAGRAQVVVYGAASTADVVSKLGDAFTQAHGIDVRYNFASSGVLARQLMAGAPASLYLSANTNWMNRVEQEGLLKPGTRQDCYRNRLTLIVPKGGSLDMSQFPVGFDGSLAVGDFKSVPAGTYAHQALTNNGWLDDLEGQLVFGSNVRTTLLYVERGEADAGIVYETDAMQSDRVDVAWVFDATSHAPIVYAVAALQGASAEAIAFLQFMLSDPGMEIARSFGFSKGADEAQP